MEAFCQLPITEKVHTASFQSHAFPLSIVQAHPDYSDDWIADKFINFVYHPSYLNRFMNYNTDWHFRRCNALTEYELSFHLDDLQQIDFLQLIEESLTSGLYCSGQWNEKYIPRKTAYQSFDFLHEYLIYGFDRSTRNFFCIGYLKDETYTTYAVSYQNFINALRNAGHLIPLSLFRQPKNFSAKIDSAAVIKGIYDYTDSVDSVLHDKNGIFGFAAIDALIAELQALLSSGEPPDMRYIRSYYEHKKMMKTRLFYLAKRAVLPYSFAKEYSKIAENAETIHMLTLKALFTNRMDFMVHAIERMKANQQYEKNYFRQFRQLVLLPEDYV